MNRSDESTSRRTARRFGVPPLVATLIGTTVATTFTLLTPGVAAAAGPAQLYLESFQNKQVTAPIIKPTPQSGTNVACLTAATDTVQTPLKGCGLSASNTGFGVLDADGSGALRLTDNTAGTNEVGGAFYSASVSSTASSGIDLGFNVYQYGSNTPAANTSSPGFKPPADGISFSLAAVDPAVPQAPATLGPAGGNLGYNGHGSGLSPTGNGLSNGYLGIGFDIHGNFSNSSFESGKAVACTNQPAWATVAVGSHYFPQSVTVRGPGNGLTGYCMLNSTLNNGALASANDPGGNPVSNTIPSSQFADGVTTNGSTTFTSASANFTAADVGAPIMETDAQGAIFDDGPNGVTYSTIVAVTNATTVTLSHAATGSATGVAFYISRSRLFSMPRIVTDAVLNNGSTTLTSATANFTSSDVGAVVSDAAGSIDTTAGVYIASVASATSVTLSAAAGSNQTGDRLYIGPTNRSAVSPTAAEVAINPSGCIGGGGSASPTKGINGLATVSVPACSYAVTFKPPGGTQQTLKGSLPTSANGLIPAGSIPNSWINPATGIPYQLSFGWTGSTGANNAIQEINLTQAQSLGSTPPIYTLTTTDRVAGDFFGNFSGDGPSSRTQGIIYYNGGLDANGSNETLGVSLDMYTTKGLAITQAASGPGWTCPATSVATDFTDGNATNGSTTFTSATASFTARDVGRTLIPLDGQGAIPSGTTIAAVTDATTITMSAAATATTTNASFGVGSIGSFSDGSITTGTTALSSVSAALVTEDAGSLIVETDNKGAIPSQTTISSVAGGVATLSKTATATASSIAFNILRPNSATNQMSASCTLPTPGSSYAAGSSFTQVSLPVMVVNGTTIFQPSLPTNGPYVAWGNIHSLDGNPAYAADPGVSTNPYQRAPTPVFVGTFQQFGPATGKPPAANTSGIPGAATLKGGWFDTTTSLTWGTSTLPVCSVAPFSNCYSVASTSPYSISVFYPSQTSSGGAASPSITVTNGNGATPSGQPFTYYPAPTITDHGPRNRTAATGSLTAAGTGYTTVTVAAGATDLSGSNVQKVWWGDGRVNVMAACVTPITSLTYNCFDRSTATATSIRVYPPGENDGVRPNYGIARVGPPVQSAHTANVSIEVKVGGVTEDFAEIGTYTYDQPTASGNGTGPTSGGTTVTITGLMLNSTSVLTVDGTPYTVCVGPLANGCYIIDSYTQIRLMTLPHAAGAVPISQTIDGVVVATGTFTYVPPGTPTAVGNGVGPIKGGTDVIITGTLLSGTTSITFDGISLSPCAGGILTTGCYIIDSATQIRTESPAHPVGTGPIVLVVSGFTLTAGTFRWVDPTTIPGPPPRDPPIEVTEQRIGGKDRDDTAAQVAKKLFPDGGAPLVVLARDDIFADGLTGSPLAYHLGGPVLLTPTARLADSTRDAIHAVLKPAGIVIILGGTDAVSAPVEEELRGGGYSVERIGGINRYETASLVANRLLKGKVIDHVYLATGVKFGDAIAAAGLASANRGAVLLTVGDQMSNFSSDWIAQNGEKDVTAVGHPAALAAPTVPRIEGQDAFSTSALAAKAAYPQPNGVVIATGTTFPDALAGAVYAAFKRLPQILVNPTASTMDAETNSYLANAPLQTIVALGGPDAVPETSIGLIRDVRGAPTTTAQVVNIPPPEHRTPISHRRPKPLLPPAPVVTVAVPSTA